MNAFLQVNTLNQLPEEEKQKTQKIKRKTSTTLEIDTGEQLDKIFPPKCISEDGELKVIQVSRKQATLFQIYKLNDDLDSVVDALENEETGFSSKLTTIYNNLFDELIRQEIIACPERGLLMVKIRDEALETLESMQNLYRSCFAYAVTKDLLTRRDIIEKRKDIPIFLELINRAEETLQSTRIEWEERKNLEEEEERIKIIKQTFMQNQLIIENQQMVNQIEDIIDAEHKWLKDLDNL